MSNGHAARALTFATVALLAPAVVACGEEPQSLLPVEPLASVAAGSEWSDPVHLVSLSSPYWELGPNLSPDGLSLYFGSNRPGGYGGLDFYVARRACPDCPWGPPVNLGPIINSPGNDGDPAFSPDGLLLFFASHREGGQGSADIWVSRRTDKNDDFSWGPPVNLAGVNTVDHETVGGYIPALNGGGGTLYFSAGPEADLQAWDIYEVKVTPDGTVRGSPTPVSELNSASLETGPRVRRDGKEVFFWSTRPGGPGSADIWVATRQSVAEPWSEPRSVDEINTAGGELTPGISLDGETLVFSGAKTGWPSLGFQDLWISVRR